MLDPLPAFVLDLYARVNRRSRPYWCSSSISCRIFSDQLLVSLPFLLKDLFKRSFPSALWGPDVRCWVIPLEQAERLNQWIRLVERSGLLEEIRAIERRLPEAQEAQALSAELDQLRDEIRDSLEETIKKDQRLYRKHLKAEMTALKRDFAQLRAARHTQDKQPIPDQSVARDSAVSAYTSSAEER
ncbi:hypothetical protein CKO42_09705 [Lamprobacter modestohalophilus]|uniref:Uncharacterized protein n=1 Tax=Lamprobacter modestohalophilus TaxID=1064514 RepID=A0A9X1B3Q7_9GAMM|nr:hypothetical protein [Lamprobacter modestohalophilus]MBK1618703.1 hypothetical protein [Lamprobacter modestohalophilus]MCF7994790.1 hypothetical protein [Chromatiaceae bacterium]MCF8016724.1 hypothetical protein [Chromatiaceae bacterium]